MHRDEWTTYCELQFLKKVLKKKSKSDQTIFIEKFSKTMELRKNWDNINKIEIESFLNRKLQTLTRGVN